MQLWEFVATFQHKLSIFEETLKQLCRRIRQLEQQNNEMFTQINDACASDSEDLSIGEK